MRIGARKLIFTRTDTAERVELDANNAFIDMARTEDRDTYRYELRVLRPDSVAVYSLDGPVRLES